MTKWEDLGETAKKLSSFARLSKGAVAAQKIVQDLFSTAQQEEVTQRLDEIDSARLEQSA